MNPAVPAAGPEGQQQQQQPQRPSIMKMILIYMVINQVINYFFKSGQPAPPPDAPANYTTIHKNVFRNDEPLEFVMYISESKELLGNETPAWTEKGLKYNFDKENLREKTIVFDIDELFKNTTDPTLYAHFQLRNLRSKDTIDYTEYARYLTINRTINLIDHRAKDKNLDQENLLFKEEKNGSEVSKKVSKDEEFPHLKTKIWIQLIHDENSYPLNQIPPQISPTFGYTENGIKIYEPILDVSQFWLRKKDFQLLDPLAENKTVATTFVYNTYWVYKYMMESQLKQTNSMYDQFGMGGENMDEIKEMILDSNPVLVGTTMVVSMLHSLFEFLALKNEISFWRNIESHKGLSLRTLWVSLVTEIIVLLYLFDNETSFLILFGSIAGLGVTIWKIYKTTKFRRRPDGKFPFIEVDYQDAYKSTTMEYDQAASKYLSWLLVPLLGGYTIYSLLYEKHKGWYSFVVQTLVGFIYVFGFIEMTPQLYINYKLKSVEHLPWRVMIYKFLNTIVDDLFAFVITMPWLKRLSCFRDDIIFVIYLYQRYIYRVDKNRDPYGKPIPKEELEAQRKLEEAQKKKKEDPQQALPPAEKTPAAATEETSTVTHRKTQEVQEKNITPEPQDAGDTSQESAQKGGKMKKKKVQ